VGKKPKLVRIEVKKHQARGRAEFVPFVVFAAGRHEGELPRKAPEPRSSHPFDAGLPIASSATLINHEQMDRPPEMIFKLSAARGLNAFGHHAANRNGSASYDICRKNLHDRVGGAPVNEVTRLKRSYSRIRDISRG